jgi:hypothetical protein
MALDRFLPKVNLAHLPTVLLAIGYPVYWLELYGWRHPTGHTSWLATAVFAAVALGILAHKIIALRWMDVKEDAVRAYKSWAMFDRIVLAAGLCLSLTIVLCALSASALPPHLQQEFDVINYHLTLPRQHLILNSFAPLSWSTADLFLMPVDFALAPYWLATDLPNKWPQFLFSIALLAIVFRSVRRMGGGHWAGALAVLAVLGTHAVGIQMGTAMLDLAVCYLFFAALDSFLSGQMILAAVEFSFFFWSKPLMPVFIGMILVLSAVVTLLLSRGFGWKTVRGFLDITGPDAIEGKKVFIIAFFLVSLAVAGPFMVKSWQIAQTPLYPVTDVILKPGGCVPANLVGFADLQKKACAWKLTKDSYGHGRSLGALLRHFWLVAVPETGVNNAFDYPLGLTYLLFLGPFMALLARSFRLRKVPVLGVFCVVYWLLWWMGSQQARFFLVPLVGMFVTVAAGIGKPSRVLLSCLVLALTFTAISVFRAHQPDFGKSAYQVLRDKDKELLVMANDAPPRQPVALDFNDAAFAPFAIDVRGADNIFVIQRP